MTALMETRGYLFDTKTQKFLELIPGNARFHSAPDRATTVSKSDFDDVGKRHQLLDHHNVDWYAPTVTFVATDAVAA